jgi:putative DNA primase/helicase
MPMAVARLFIDHKIGGMFTLRHWRGAWWCWRTSHWAEIDSRAVRSWLYAYTENAFYIENEDLVNWSPNRYKITDLADALSAVCILQADIDQPTWLDNRSAGTIVATANGLLDIKDRKLLPHSPQFFNQTSVPFSYNPSAPQPLQWLNFLAELWPNEQEAIDALGEWFGWLYPAAPTFINCF